MAEDKDLYDELGIGKDATDDEIKKAYRKRASETHPDKGGSNEEFALVKLAYDVLIDPVKRSKYDNTGEKQETPFEMRFNDFVRQYIIRIIISLPDPKTADLMMGFKTLINDFKKQNKNKLKQLRNGEEVQLDRLKQTRERLKYKGKGQDSIGFIFDNEIHELERKIKAFKFKIKDDDEFLDKVLERLKQYVYEFDEETEEEMISKFLSSSSTFRFNP